MITNWKFIEDIPAHYWDTPRSEEQEEHLADYPLHTTRVFFSMSAYGFGSEEQQHPVPGNTWLVTRNGWFFASFQIDTDELSDDDRNIAISLCEVYFGPRSMKPKEEEEVT